MKKQVISLILVLLVGIIFILGAGFYKFIQLEDVYLTKTFAANDISNLKVESGIGNINIKKSASTEIKVEVTGKYQSDKNINITPKYNENVLSIVVDDAEEGWFNWNLDILDSGEKLVNVYLPEKEFNNIELHTRVGKIHVSELKANEWDLLSNVGNIMLENIVGEVHASSNTGKITMSNELFNNDVKIKTDVGEVSVIIGQDQKEIHLDLYSHVGKKNIDLPHTNYHKGVSIEAPTIKATTRVGKINILNN